MTGFSACKKDDPTATETRLGWTLSAPAYMDGKLAPIAIIGADEGYAELISALSPFVR